MSDDPRKLRSLVERASLLALQHEVPSVMVGLIAPRGDRRFPDFVDFVESALRVEDGVFRMTRERTVLHLADVDRTTAEETLARVLGRFQDEFPTSAELTYESYFVEILPGRGELTVKDVLPQLFGAEPIAGDDAGADGETVH
ncbi:MAG: hypothetical protein R3E88_06530 [Myxococcota bacterium]|nr:hypothetical protein [Myxococcales bacterium]